MDMDNEDIATTEPMATAYRAIQYVRNGGTDYSNGAYFWDGDDLKSNYANHDKVKLGIKFTDPKHNIFDVPESKGHYTFHEVTVQNGKKNKVTGVVEQTYESTIAYSGTYPKTKWEHIKDKDGKVKKVKTVHQVKTGTVFWKFTPEWIKRGSYGKEYL